MKRSVSDRARRLAAELQRLFAQDTDLAHNLNDARRRLLDVNNRLSSGIHRDGLRALDGDHPVPKAAQLEPTLRSRSQVLDSPDVLETVQAVHWQIHQAHCDHERIAEDRRHLAAEIGEIIRTLLYQLVAAGWSEQQARSTDIRALANSEEDALGTWTSS
jgi:hypothetical protein